MEGTIEEKPGEVVVDPDVKPAAQDPLVRSLRSVRRWMIALVVLVAMTFTAVGGFIGWTLYDDYQTMYGGDYADAGPSPQMVQPLKDSVTAAYGADLESVEVRQIELTYAVDEDTAPDRPFLVTYKLQGSPVTMTGLVDDTADLGVTGVVPVQASLDTALSLRELRDLMARFAEKSTGPMGRVYPYASDSGEQTHEPGESITVDGVEYLVDDLWSVNEGWAPTAMVVTWESVPSAKALIFEQNDDGTFTYVGTEPAQLENYTSSDGGC